LDLDPTLVLSEVLNCLQTKTNGPQDQRLRRKPRSLGVLLITQLTKVATRPRPGRKGRPRFLPESPVTPPSWSRSFLRSTVRELQWSMASIVYQGRASASRRMMWARERSSGTESLRSMRRSSSCGLVVGDRSLPESCGAVTRALGQVY
jgi:hypothetical protein